MKTTVSTTLGLTTVRMETTVRIETPVKMEIGKQLRSAIMVYYWASEASPTLKCSIEISHDIYVSVGRYVCRVPKCVGGITCVHAQSQFRAVKTDQ